jgi:hypothetical protein
MKALAMPTQIKFGTKLPISVQFTLDGVPVQPPYPSRIRYQLSDISVLNIEQSDAKPLEAFLVPVGIGTCTVVANALMTSDRPAPHAQSEPFEVEVIPGEANGLTIIPGTPIPI